MGGEVHVEIARQIAGGIHIEQPVEVANADRKQRHDQLAITSTNRRISQVHQDGVENAITISIDVEIDVVLTNSLTRRRSSRRPTPNTKIAI